MINYQTVVGRLIKDPVILNEKAEEDKRVVAVTLGVSRNKKEKDDKHYPSDVVECKFFGKKATYIATHYKKGHFMVALGRSIPEVYMKPEANGAETPVLKEVMNVVEESGPFLMDSSAFSTNNAPVETESTSEPIIKPVKPNKPDVASTTKSAVKPIVKPAVKETPEVKPKVKLKK